MTARRLYRVMFAHAGAPDAGVRTPEGRFHHDGQRALYASETVEGAVVAVMSYVTGDDPARAVHPLRLTGARLFDARDPDAVRALGLAPDIAAGVWRDDRAAGRPSRTWALSDAVRATALDGMLYASRKRPDLTHVVLFRWNGPAGAQLLPDGPAAPFRPL